MMALQPDPLHIDSVADKPEARPVATIDPATKAAYNATRGEADTRVVCHAPFTSIYFGHLGYAYSCCYNYEHSLGRYPEQSIHEMWFGSRAKTLRRHMAADDLSLGCLTCQDMLLAGDFHGVTARTADIFPRNSNNYPSDMNFELGNHCPLECLMCDGKSSSSIRRNREKAPPLDDPYDEDFVDQLDEFIPHLVQARFFGGEPLLIGLYRTIWQKLAHKNPTASITIQTSAAVLPAEVKSLMERSEFGFTVSLDSLNKTRYETIRKNARFEQTLDNLFYLREYCRHNQTWFGISFCCLVQNWFEMPEFFRFFNSLNVPVYVNTVLNPSTCALRGLSSARLAGIVEFLAGHTLEDRTAVQAQNRLFYEDFVKLVDSWRQQAEAREEASLGSDSGFCVDFGNEFPSSGQDPSLCQTDPLNQVHGEAVRSDGPAIPISRLYEDLLVRLRAHVEEKGFLHGSNPTEILEETRNKILTVLDQLGDPEAIAWVLTAARDMHEAEIIAACRSHPVEALVELVHENR